MKIRLPQAREVQLEGVFSCAWRPGALCKGYCDFLGITEADLTHEE
jgi:hypothetical protein